MPSTSETRQGRLPDKLKSVPRILLFERITLGATLFPAIFAEYLPYTVTIPTVLLIVSLPLARFLKEPKGPSMQTLPVWLLAWVFLPMSVMVSPLQTEVSWPRAVCLIWSLAMFGTIANDTGPARIRLPVWMGVFLAAGVLFSLLDLAFLNLPDNEVGGILILFLPLALALAAAPRNASEAPRITWIAAAGLLIASVVLTGSRGAMLGAAVGAGVLVLILGRKKGLIALAVAILFAVAGGVVLWRHATFRTFILGGTIQGASLEHFTTGRVPIWESSLHAIRDFPFSGIGIGVLGRAFPKVYPTGYESRILEDAHNQFLQAAADFGVVGGIVWVAVLCAAAATCIRLIRRFPTGHLPLFVVAGCAAALAGHCIYSLGDSVSPGSPGGMPFWFLMALVIRLDRQLAQRKQRKGSNADSPRRRSHGAAIALIAVALIALVPAILSKDNRRASGYVQLLLTGSPPEFEAAYHNARKDLLPPCRHRWLRGLIAEAGADEAGRIEEWKALIHCSRARIRLVRSRAPASAVLAKETISTWPNDAAGFFWMAEIVAIEAPDEAVNYLRDGLKRSPSSGREWRKLGDLLSAGNKDLPGALDAYHQACDHGDPGAGGCFMAGSVAELLGRRDEALNYYRKSNWEPAQKRARELEADLRAGR